MLAPDRDPILDLPILDLPIVDDQKPISNITFDRLVWDSFEAWYFKQGNFSLTPDGIAWRAAKAAFEAGRAWK